MTSLPKEDLAVPEVAAEPPAASPGRGRVIHLLRHEWTLASLAGFALPFQQRCLQIFSERKRLARFQRSAGFCEHAPNGSMDRFFGLVRKIRRVSPMRILRIRYQCFFARRIFLRAVSNSR